MDAIAGGVGEILDPGRHGPPGFYPDFQHSQAHFVPEGLEEGLVVAVEAVAEDLVRVAGLHQ